MKKQASISTVTFALAAALFLALPSGTIAMAPPRAGQPYAESICNTDPNVIFCEDFNYPTNFFCSLPTGNGNARWTNPGFYASSQTTDFIQCGGRQINAATTYPAKPQGAMPSSSQPDFVWAANWDPTKGIQGQGASWGLLRNSGGNYVNGSAPTPDVYVRLQVYWTANYAWPGDPKVDPYNYGGNSPVDNKILFIYPPEGVGNPTASAYDAGFYTAASVYEPADNARFADALTVRVGDCCSGSGFELFPMCYACTYNPSHMEYAPFQSLTLRNPGDQAIIGRIFRFNTNRWYTLELHYKLSSAPSVRDGTIEVWIDGTKIYSASDLATCGSGGGDCSGIGAIFLGAYHNGSDMTVWNGQQVVDNLVISRAYIGPPKTGVVNAMPPARPVNLTLR